MRKDQEQFVGEFVEMLGETVLEGGKEYPKKQMVIFEMNYVDEIKNSLKEEGIDCTEVEEQEVINSIEKRMKRWDYDRDYIKVLLNMRGEMLPIGGNDTEIKAQGVFLVKNQ